MSANFPRTYSPAAPSQMEFHGEGKTFKSLSYCTAGRENQAVLYNDIDKIFDSQCHVMAKKV